MTPQEFTASLAAPRPPAGIGGALAALWWAARGDWAMGEAWTNAHEAAQADDGADAAWVHAHLHRIEGDLDNAGYWYRRAGQPRSAAPLREEWQAISEALLAQHP
jgi:hypothetical protein